MVRTAPVPSCLVVALLPEVVHVELRPGCGVAARGHHIDANTIGIGIARNIGETTGIGRYIDVDIGTHVNTCM